MNLGIGIGIVALSLVGLVAAVWLVRQQGTASASTSSPRRIADTDGARRLARAIASDITLYHEVECAEARASGVISPALDAAIAEGRGLFEARVAPAFAKLYDAAIDEVVLKPRG